MMSVKAGIPNMVTQIRLGALKPHPPLNKLCVYEGQQTEVKWLKWCVAFKGEKP